MAPIEDRLKHQAHALGFELVGIAPATESDGFERLRDWLARGFAGTMDYLYRHGEARRHPSSILPEVRSVVMVGMNYRPGERGCVSAPREVLGALTQPRSPEGGSLAALTQPRSPEGGSLGALTQPRSPAGRVSCYACGSDYHDVLRDRLHRLLDWLRQERPDCRGRGVVDTAPLLERDFARRAGLGWFGKNTMLLNKRLGSFFFLGALLTNLELACDPPHTASHCGTCTACLQACPTQAFVAPGMLDSRRCISYLTIEHRGDIPDELRSGVGDWLFGCDVCQDVCPWNRKAPPGREPALQGRPELERFDLIEVLSLSEEAFRHRFRGTALWRTKRSGLVRNAALVLGNTGDAAALPALRRALDDPEPVVREAVRWAIDQIEGRQLVARHVGNVPHKEVQMGHASNVPPENLLPTRGTSC
ncbi:MAG TPA: tRNA epoxyqueuosine(34) reductase QueG [Gemmataceae bacterium]|nr:tRNA epoxyqueuosine(34) reductase QueG [Gemmataceae bacterium]